MLLTRAPEGKKADGDKQQDQEEEGAPAGDGGADAVAVGEEGHHHFVGTGGKEGGAEGPVGPYEGALSPTIPRGLFVLNDFCLRKSPGPGRAL